MEPARIEFVTFETPRCGSQQVPLPMGHWTRLILNIPAVKHDAVDEVTPQLGGVCPPPGLPPPFGMPSHGSLIHGTGTCKPCVWFHKAGGCGNGEDCGHCHLCPKSEISDRRRRRRARLGAAKAGAWELDAPPCSSDWETAAGSDLESLRSFSPCSSRQASMSPRC